MRIPDHRQHAEVSFNMTPMIDVVFLLIIFFLVSSHLAKQEAQLALPLPVADSGELPVADKDRRIIVNVLADRTLMLAGRKVGREDLHRRLQQERQQSDGPLEIKIRADRHVDYGIVEPVMLACYRAGIWNVTFSVYRSQDVR